MLLPKLRFDTPAENTLPEAEVQLPAAPQRRHHQFVQNKLVVPALATSEGGPPRAERRHAVFWQREPKQRGGRRRDRRRLHEVERDARGRVGLPTNKVN